MLPNVRLLIAAMLATILVLMCGFGVFAAFRVSHEPIAHLPAAMAPLQLVAENRAMPSAIFVAREPADQHSQSDPSVSAPEETTAPTGTAEQHDPAEFAAESEPTAPRPAVATDVEPSAAAEPHKEAAAMASPERLPVPSAPASDLPVSVRDGDDRSADIAADAAPASTPLRPVEPAAAPPTSASDPKANATQASEAAAGEAAPVGQTTMAEAPLTRNTGAPIAETEPAAVASLMVEAMPDNALDRRERDRLLEPPLPRARPMATDTKHVRHAQPARAADERPRSAAAVRPKRTRIVVLSVRAVRFTAPYYAQAQYAQSIDQSYGYGQSNFQGASVGQEQIVVRRVVRLAPPRLVARKATAIGGPFVRAPSP